MPRYLSFLCLFYFIFILCYVLFRPHISATNSVFGVRPIRDNCIYRLPLLEWPFFVILVIYVNTEINGMFSVHVSCN